MNTATWLTRTLFVRFTSLNERIRRSKYSLAVHNVSVTITSAAKRYDVTIPLALTDLKGCKQNLSVDNALMSLMIQMSHSS